MFVSKGKEEGARMCKLRSGSCSTALIYASRVSAAFLRRLLHLGLASCQKKVAWR